MTSSRSRGLAAALLLLGAGLAGCSGDGDAPSAPPSTSGTSSESENPTANKISPPNLPVPPEVGNKAGAVADITFGDCPTEKGSQSVTGGVKNPTKKPLSYVITFNWINDTSDVLGRGFAVVKNLDGDASADWSITAKVVDGATQCVPNVVRGQLADG